MEWPLELIEDIARRRAVLYIGAGASASTNGDDGKRPPDWITFLKDANRRLGRKVPRDTVRDLINDQDLLTACELLKKSLDETWPEVLKQEFIEPHYQAGDLHREIHNLDLPIVITPNFDTIYDRFASHETRGATVVKNYYDVDLPMYIRRNYRVILKAHGTIDEPSRMVFTRGDYAKMREHHRSFSNLLESLFLTHTFLFIGTSFNDPDLRLFLESMRYMHPEAPPHYMTSPIGEVSKHVDESIRGNMNLKLLRYSPDNGHSALVEGVRDLVSAVVEKRGILAATESW